MRARLATAIAFFIATSLKPKRDLIRIIGGGARRTG